MNPRAMTKNNMDRDEYIEKLSRQLFAHTEPTGSSNCNNDFTITRKILNNLPPELVPLVKLETGAFELAPITGPIIG